LGATGPQGIGVTGATGPIPPGLFYATGDQVISGEKTFLADSFVFSGANVQFIEGTGTVSGTWNFQVRPTLNNHGLISANDLSGLAQNVIPATSGVYNLGSPEKPFKDIYLTTGSVYLGNAVISASGDSVVLPQGTIIAGGGALGATGPQGATGPAGSNGATGATGETGSAGATGATGTAGSNGATGATGETGSAGATGATGTAGSNGATGATGTAGSNGATGATGSGATGATGAAGLSGDKYTTTSTTSESIGTGSKTFTVDSGLALSTGQTVIIAYDASNKMEGTVTSYSVTTLVVNVTSVTGSGGPYTSWSISLSGAPGPQGATGLTGTAGSNGATGATGTAGSNGATGATGTAGSNGATGATGEAGSAGATGATGTAGGNGATGATGATATNACIRAHQTVSQTITNFATTYYLLDANAVFNGDTNVFTLERNSAGTISKIKISATGRYLINAKFNCDGYNYDRFFRSVIGTNNTSVDTAITEYQYLHQVRTAANGGASDTAMYAASCLLNVTSQPIWVSMGLLREAAANGNTIVAGAYTPFLEIIKLS
jgi:hypothetical protein